jgi:hypothetical protein
MCYVVDQQSSCLGIDPVWQRTRVRYYACSEWSFCPAVPASLFFLLRLVLESAYNITTEYKGGSDDGQTTRWDSRA